MNSLTTIKTAIGLGVWAAAQLAFAQLAPGGTILYNNYHFSGGQPFMELSTIRPDGSADSPLPVNLPEAGFPALSRDGRVVALTSADPKKLFTLSRDVFLLDLTSSKIAQLTSFPNTWSHVDTNTMGNVDVSQAGYTLPWYKAFSPEGLRLAVSEIAVTGATFTYTNQLNPQDNNLTSGFASTPKLSVYRFDGSPPVLVAVGDASSDDVHVGDGVDWSPVTDLLVWPATTYVKFSGFYGSTYPPQPVTAIFIMVPVNDAIGSGKALPLSSPQGSAGLLPNFAGTYFEWQADYQPAFSPNGKQVAYIRSDNLTATTVGSGYVSKPSLRIVNIDATGDREITNFNVGVYISHLSWSPDGSQLVFDLGPQAIGPLNFPYLAAVPQTDALFTINTNGTALKQLRGPAATWPVWSPAPATVAPPPQLAMAPVPGTRQLTFSWPANSGNWAMETSAQLGSQAKWQPVTNAPVAVNGQQTLTLTPASGAWFFRLKQF